MKPLSPETQRELVAMFERVMGWIRAWEPSFTEDDEWPETDARAKAALAKARAEMGGALPNPPEGQK